MNPLLRTPLYTLSLSLAALFAGCSPNLDTGSADSPLVDGVLDPTREPSADYLKTNEAQPLGHGGLAVSRDGSHALLSDVDGNQLLWVDLASGTVKNLPLDAVGSIPGRPVVDENGTFFVPLLNHGRLQSVRSDGSRGPWAPVCAQPRSVAVQSGGQLIVACANGDVMRLHTTPGAITLDTTIRLTGYDLQDVQFVDREIWINTFQSGQLVRLGLDLSLLGVVQHPEWMSPPNPTSLKYEPRVQWRMTPLGSDRALVSVQQHQALTLGMGIPYYGAPLPIMPFVTQFGPSGAVEASTAAGTPTNPAVLPTDLAVSHNGVSVLLIAAGNIPISSAATAMKGPVGNRAPLFFASVTSGSTPSLGDFRGITPTLSGGAVLMPDAVDSYDEKDFIVHARRPNALYIITAAGAVSRTIALPTVPDSPMRLARDDFSAGNGQSLACASCHVEAGHDRNIWTTPSGAMLRTLALQGTLQGKADFRWSGSDHDITTLVASDMQRFGDALTADGAQNLGNWLMSLRPNWQPLVWRSEIDAAARGEQVFAQQACASCHSGPALTTGQIAKVGGQDLTVPSLRNVGNREPFGHDGRASSLQALFNDQNEPVHYVADPAARDDLSQYLKSL